MTTRREAGRSDPSADDPRFRPWNRAPDVYDYIVMDANESDDMAMRCAFITDEYTHPDVADYPEEITDADGDTYTWEHVYEGGTGMLAHIYVSDSLLYNPKQEHGLTPFTYCTLVEN